MRLKAAWDPKWSAWCAYTDKHTGKPYRTRRRRLLTGLVVLGTLVQCDQPRYGKKGHTFFMYCTIPWQKTAVTGNTVFRTVRGFLRVFVAR